MRQDGAARNATNLFPRRLGLVRVSSTLTLRPLGQGRTVFDARLSAGRRSMHIIEVITGFSPDGDSGLTEMLWLAALGVGMMVLIAPPRRAVQVFRRRWRRTTTGRR